MLQGVNILAFYEDISNRRWDNTDVRDYIIYVDNTDIPGFIVSKFIGGTHELTGQVGLFDINNNFITAYELECYDSDGVTPASFNAGNKVIKFAGVSDAELNLSHYYLQIELSDDSSYFSDVFAVNNSDVKNNLIGFSISSADLTFIEDVMFPMSSIYLKFYVPYGGINISAEVKEDGIEKTFGNIPIFSTVNILNKVEIYGNSQIFRVLAMLRVMNMSGGSVYILINNMYTKIYDSSVEVKDDSAFGDSIIITLSYREYNFLSSRNAV